MPQPARTSVTPNFRKAAPPCNSAASEAQMFFRMLRRGEETLEGIRKLIGNQSEYRRRVRAHFDALADPQNAAEKNAVRVIRLLRAGWPHCRIQAALHV